MDLDRFFISCNCMCQGLPYLMRLITITVRITYFLLRCDLDCFPPVLFIYIPIRAFIPVYEIYRYELQISTYLLLCRVFFCCLSIYEYCVFVYLFPYIDKQSICENIASSFLNANFKYISIYIFRILDRMYFLCKQKHG